MIAAIILAGLMFMVLWRALKPGALTQADEVHVVKSRDGFRLPLFRFMAKGRRKGVAVLCHGLGANRHNMDFQQVSMTRWLQERGYEVFLLEMRGSGMTLDLNDCSRKEFWNYNFDTFVRRDVPALLKRIRELSGSDELVWIGHSMGGMIGYAAAGTRADHHGISSLVCIGSPSVLTPLPARIRMLASIVTRVFPHRIRKRPFTLVLSMFLPVLRFSFDDTLANPRQFSTRSIEAALRNVTADVSSSLIRQFVLWMTSGRITSADGRIDYVANLKDVRIPVLFVAGNIDRICPVELMKPAFESLGSRDKRLVVLGQQYGTRLDYGHTDLVLGDAVCQEVFPAIGWWLGTPTPVPLQGTPVAEPEKIASYQYITA